MAAPNFKKSQGNSSSTTLSSGVSNSDTSAPLTSDTNFDGEGMVIISEGEAVEELAYATAKAGGALTIPLANRGLEGGSAQTHSNGATVKGILSAGMWNDMIDGVLTEHNDDGTHGAVTATSVALGGDTALAGNASQAEVATGTSDALVVTPTGASIYGNSSMARQAIMNGNFDVWQRGTSFTPSASSTYLADRWLVGYNADGGTLPTDTFSLQYDPANLDGSYFYMRLNVDGAGSSFGTNANYSMAQKIEHGTRYLAGAGKTVTLSYYAKSDIADKKIGVVLLQSYGTGGSPSTAEWITGTSETLTSSWTKYTHTFTLNTLSGKTFGSAADDYIQVNFTHMWGSTWGSTYLGDGVAEDFGGSGNIDIAQVQLCAGSVALPFQPKSYAQELADCQRYCIAYTSSVATAFPIGVGYAYNTTLGFINVHLPTEMRTPPSLTATASDWDLAYKAASAALSTLAIGGGGNSRTTNTVRLSATVGSAVLTAGECVNLVSDGTADRLMYFDAEL